MTISQSPELSTEVNERLLRYLLDDRRYIGIPSLFRVEHLNRDITIGLVGDKGAGKSLGGGTISFLDYMIRGEPCFSNMQVRAIVEVDEGLAGEYGAYPGKAIYESQLLDKQKFLTFSPEYRNGVFFTHEFNIWLADARRSTSNLNLDTDDVGQQLRKLKSAWVYDCIDEAFVDVRIRDNTDIFIRTKDTALTPEGMARKQPQGVEFMWQVYPMTDMGAARLRWPRFGTKEFTGAKGPFYVKGKQLWGLIDTTKQEHREKYKRQYGQYNVDLKIGESPELTEAINKWGFLQDKLQTLKRDGYKEIVNSELWRYLQLEERGLDSREVGKVLRTMNINWKRRGRDLVYQLDEFDLSNEPKRKKVAVVK